MQKKKGVKKYEKQLNVVETTIKCSDIHIIGALKRSRDLGAKSTFVFSVHDPELLKDINPKIH